MKRLGWTEIVLAVLVLGWPAWGSASGESFAVDDSFAVYEDWTTSPTLRSDRWVAVDVGALDVERKVKGHAFIMRTRREGGTASDVGFRIGRQRLIFANPAAIDRLGAVLKVRELALTGCATNPSQASRVFAAIYLNRFNDGSGAPGNMTGDHVVSVSAYRESNSPDPEGTLRLRGVIGRCIDAVCSDGFSIPGGVVDLPRTVVVGERFTMRVVWDAANHRFLVGVGDDPDVAIPYPPEVNQQPAGVAFADIRTLLVAANCASGSTVSDATVAVRKVKTNASAIVP
jgi:hypothetical protein